MEMLQAIGSISGAIALVLLVVFKNSTQKYVDEKAKNLATIEDTKRITSEVERVKARYLQRSHAWKQIFEKEYSLLRDVWGSTWEFQDTAKSLRPLVDRLPKDQDRRKKVFAERRERHVEAVSRFIDLVLKNRPFLPPHVYESCLSLRGVVVELQVHFDLSYEDDRPDLEMILKCTKSLDVELERLNSAIRDHIYGKVNTAEQGGAPVALPGAGDL